MQFVVICREDRKDDGSLGRYVLATRTTFDTEAAAEAYARTIHPSRDPLVVAGCWSQLRPPEDYAVSFEKAHEGNVLLSLMHDPSMDVGPIKLINTNRRDPPDDLLIGFGGIGPDFAPEPE